MSSKFDVNKDVEVLEKAMKGWGTDEKAIADVLANRTVNERREIAKVYKASYGRDLLDRLRKELSGKFKEVVLLSFLDKAHLHARALFDAMVESGAKASVIIQVVCTSSNEEIADLRDAYRDILVQEGENPLRRDIEKDIRSGLHGDFEKFIVALLQGIREQTLDKQAAEEDMEALYAAGEKRLGTDEHVFTRTFAIRSYETIQVIDELYYGKTGHGIRKGIENETSGDYRDALTTVAKMAHSKYECIADFLLDSMKGIGTRDESLIRLILSYSEDNMDEIKKVFANKCGKSLEQWIQEDTSGDYRHFLLTLVGNT